LVVVSACLVDREVRRVAAAEARAGAVLRLGGERVDDRTTRVMLQYNR